MDYFERFIDSLNSDLTYVGLIGDKFNAKARVILNCKFHGQGDLFDNKWTPAVSSVISGFGCPKCAGKYRFTKNELIKKIEDKGYHFINFIGDFKGGSSKVNLKCPKHGEGAEFYTPWEPNISNLLHHNKGCPKCAGVYKRTEDEWIKVVNRSHYTFCSFNSKLKGNKTKVVVACSIHGRGNLFSTPWLPTLDDISSGRGCPKCSGLYRYDKDEYIQLVESASGYKFIEFISPFKVIHTRINLRCAEHGDGKLFETPWLPTINNILRGGACPKCQNRYVYSENEIVNKIGQITEYKFIKFVTDAGRGVNSRVIVECPHHNPDEKRFSQWETTPHALFHGRGCPTHAEYGFNKSKAAYFYLQRLYLADDLIGLKYGITNQNPKSRMNQQSTKSMLRHDLVSSFYLEEGWEIYEFEQSIHNHFKELGVNCFLSKEIMPDGYTETVAVNYKDYILTEMSKFTLDKNQVDMPKE